MVVRGRRWIYAACMAAAVSVLPLSGFANAGFIPSQWAEAEFTRSISLGIVPWELYQADYDAAISREAFCVLLVNGYCAQTGQELSAEQQPVFSDTTCPEVAIAYQLGLVTGDPDGQFRPYDQISRQEAAVMLSKLQALLGKAASAGQFAVEHFSDEALIADWAQDGVAAVADTGLMRGLDDGRFAPLDNVSVQQAVVLAGRLVDAAPQSRPEIVSPAAFSVVSSQEPLQLLFDRPPSSQYELMAVQTQPGGSSRAFSLGTTVEEHYTVPAGTFQPNEAYKLVVGEDSVWSDALRIFTDAPQLRVETTLDGTTATVRWDRIPGIDSYHVQVVEWRTTKHAEEIGARDPVYFDVDSGNTITFAVNPDKRYVITVWTDNGYTDTVELMTPEAVSMEQKQAELAAFGEITTKEQADALMETVKVNVWRLEDGKKIASTAYITVHPAIAEAVEAVFQEIFEGEERFPILSAGGYNWRENDPNVSKSEHNLGTAIDINPDQNYCIYGSGDIVGSYWKPYEDPYSITPYGEVIRAFERHGFVWGGDSWSTTRDYMHFSYLGT